MFKSVIAASAALSMSAGAPCRTLQLTSKLIAAYPDGRVLWKLPLICILAMNHQSEPGKSASFYNSRCYSVDLRY